MASGERAQPHHFKVYLVAKIRLILQNSDSWIIFDGFNELFSCRSASLAEQIDLQSLENFLGRYRVPVQLQIVHDFLELHIIRFHRGDIPKCRLAECSRPYAKHFPNLGEVADNLPMKGRDTTNASNLFLIRNT